MIRLSLLLIMVGAFAAAPRASAACRWFGTQLECNVGKSRLLIGTQAAEKPTLARSFPIRWLHVDGGFPDDHVASRHPFVVEIQDFGAEPSLCRRIGNETYCY